MPWFRKHHTCPCGTDWWDEWDCLCDDRCPTCNAEIEPDELRAAEIVRPPHRHRVELGLDPSAAEFGFNPVRITVNRSRDTRNADDSADGIGVAMDLPDGPEDVIRLARHQSNPPPDVVNIVQGPGKLTIDRVHRSVDRSSEAPNGDQVRTDRCHTLVDLQH